MIQAFKQRLREIAPQRVFVWSWRLNLAVFLVISAVLAISWSHLPPLVPLFYSLPWGEEQLASTLTLPICVVIALVICVVNFLLAIFYYRTSAYLAKMLLWGALFVTLLMAITLGKIIWLML